MIYNTVEVIVKENNYFMDLSVRQNLNIYSESASEYLSHKNSCQTWQNFCLFSMKILNYLLAQLDDIYYN